MKTGHLDGQGIAEIRNYNFQKLSSAPTTGLTEGRFYYNTTDHTLYVYDGSAWVNALSQGRIYLEGLGIKITGNTIAIDPTVVAQQSDIPTDNSELTNGAGYITGITGAMVTTALGYTPYNATNPNGYQANVIESIKVNGTAQTITAKAVDIAVPTTAADVDALPDTTKYGATLDLSLNTTDYKLTVTLKDQDGTALSSKVVDFPIESVVVNGSYDAANKKIVLTLQNGTTIDIPVADLVAGLQTEITSTNMLDADLVDDSTSAHKFVSAAEKSTWNGKQDAISDLATIRAGAALGATAAQPSDLATKAPLDTYLAPNFDGITPIATYEFDTSSTSFYKLLTFNNIYATTEAIPVARALFRITATVSGKTSVINAIVETQKALTYMRVLSNHTTGYTASSNTGIRYMRSSVPKALNDGNDWELDVSTYNATARHIKVEVFQSDNGFTWFANGSVSTITETTHSSTNITYYATQGTISHPSLNMPVASAGTATYISGRLPKLLPGTMPLTGAALLASQFCFMSNSLVYPATENTVPINTGFGLAISYGAVASGVATTYYQILQKYPASSLSNIPHDTLQRGAPCFFRCTMDANGNIFSDNYVATEMTPGYTWYYVGVASSATAIMIDTTNSVFLTLDANGNLTHVNGKKCNAEWGNIAGTITDQTDLQNALDGKQATLVSGTNIKTINGTSVLGSGNISTTELPSQSGQSGKFLTTNGTTVSWATVGGGGSSTLAGLSDVTITSATSGQALTYDGSDWVNSTIYAMQIVDYTA